jgi:hypothetical protein
MENKSKKWPSGRWRQTVNLLGNPRWFESNLFHLLNIPNNLTSSIVPAALYNRKIKLYRNKDKRHFQFLLHRKNKESQFNMNFVNPKTYENMWPYTGDLNERRQLYSDTNNTHVSRQLIRRTAFTNSNTLLAFASSWNEFWSTEQTKFIGPALSFLHNDMYFFDYSSRRLRLSRSPILNPNLKTRQALNKLLSFYLEFTHRVLHYCRIYVHFQRNFYSEVKYNLYLTFTANKLFINLVSNGGMKYNYFSLSVGLFLRFLNGKKALKKNKLIKLLLMKYVRKLLIVSEIRDLVIYTKRTPVFFSELCNVLLSPIIRPFVNPLTSFLYDDTQLNSAKPKVVVKKIFFYKPKSFGTMKAPLKGRLKRKIMRRIIRTNRICD